jgi:DNA-binding NarL/FixJ family response regulator
MEQTMATDPPPLRILLLDDHEPRRTALGRALEERRVRVHHASVLEEAALDLARDDVDVVLATPALLDATPRSVSILMATLGAVPVVITVPPEPDAPGDTAGADVRAWAEAGYAVARAAAGFRTVSG